MSELKRAAQYVQDELLRDGFTVHRYDAYGTNSIYLKVDCGVCHSIRISDHRGYPHLKYRYNLNSECDRYVTDYELEYKNARFCPNCGARVVEP